MLSSSVADMETISLICGCTVVVLCMLFFSQSTNAALKRKIWPWYLLGLSAAVIGFVWHKERSLLFLCIAAPWVLAIAALNMRAVKFCDRCGKTVQGRGSTEQLVCSRCGADLS
jgi:hypothetical protein